MNTILLQKILDILTEGLAHVGDFFKDMFISEPQDGQVIGYDAEVGKWKNMSIAELSLDVTATAGPDDIITFSDAASDMPVKALNVDIVPKQASGTPTPDNPLPISGTDSIVITHNYGDNETETKTINLPSTVYVGEVDVVSGNGTSVFAKITFPHKTSFQTYNNHNYISLQVADMLNESGTHYDLISDVLAPNGTLGDKFTLYRTLQNIVVGVPDNYTIEKYQSEIEGHECYYPLATTTPITTTPTTIKTQGGTESIWSDTGDVSGEYYTATAGTIKDIVSITEDITSDITKNTTDFSDILLKVSQNNKVVSVEIYSATTSAAINETFLYGLPKPAMNCKVLLANTTLGEDGTILGTLKTTGELEITTPGAKTFSGLITYVAK